jgi:AraC family transcriptional regulator
MIAPNSFMNVEAVTLPERVGYAVRHTGPYCGVSEAFGRLCAFAGPRGLFLRSGAQTAAVYYDEPGEVSDESLRSDAFVLTETDVVPEGGVRIAEIPGGRYAKTLYVGPYSGIGDAWKHFVEKAVPAAGYEFQGGLTFDLYLNDPGSVPPEKLETELYAAIV